MEGRSPPPPPPPAPPPPAGPGGAGGPLALARSEGSKVALPVPD
jgi:hypothetical protein